MKRTLMLALLLATSLGMGQDVAQQQPQKPQLHGFKARLCATSSVRDSPAFDKCMATGFGKPRPSQRPQQAAPPQAKPPEPITANADRAQAKPQELLVKDTPAQVTTQEPLVKDTPAQVTTQEPLVKDTPAQVTTQEPLAKDTPAQVTTQELLVKDTPVQAKLQEPLVKNTPVQAKTCIEYMTTASGAQTCLRWRGDPDQ